ncbi:tRNA A37 threonylcarbamoyladenosine dehydratase [Sinobacterium caligoides]|uniref:tRNA threonylcarbamoyladenosine dehydratase n=1 Tax=Sinobacterium caligoides TaxID=933926 RepID=A0A3N2DZL7_9GAMM|nr:tRNA cyclic N6-threonylcarbamoyladenosine(37) synthase TcdA [Sinobacterium caligoides]ROS05284.1 tRNA A37 threonylcarbamoyladenosine dehydratase [Sinobacterium caligoides]
MVDSYQQRFGGIGRLYGKDSAALFLRSHVCVVGIGGVGSWAAEALARSGIGTITLIDMDDICVTNTNRQIHALVDTIGQSKVEVMAARIRQINPECDVRVIDDFITEDTLFEYIDKRYDYVLDAIDSANNKARLIAHCKRQKVGIVTTGAAGGQIDPTQITVVDLTKTVNDPLAKKVKGLLRRHYNFSKTRNFSVPCVYSTEKLRYPQPDGSACDTKAVMQDGVRLDCSGGFGAATVVTASFAFAAVAKILEKLMLKDALRKQEALKKKEEQSAAK